MLSSYKPKQHKGLSTIAKEGWLEKQKQQTTLRIGKVMLLVARSPRAGRITLPEDSPLLSDPLFDKLLGHLSYTQRLPTMAGFICAVLMLFGYITEQQTTDTGRVILYSHQPQPQE